MLLRPFLTLVRGRLIFVSLFTMFIVLLVFSNSSAESFTDLTVFWHKFCGCPPDPRDVLFFLYSFSVTACYTGGILGFITGLRLGVSTSGSGSNPVPIGDRRFLLTRPIPRRTILLNPLIIATAALALIPPAAYLLLLGWLSLVHAPALAHIAADAQLIPAVAALGPHPSFFAALTASHAWRFYLAAISLGLCTYSILYAQRWLGLSPNKHLRTLGIAPLLLFIFIPGILGSAVFGKGSIPLALFMWAPKTASLDFQPSPLTITLHLAFAAAVLFGSWRLLQQVEL